MSFPRITRAEAEAIHAASLRMFGGLPGLRDAGALESALAQPFQSFGGEELYPTDAAKAARLAFGIVSGHPFADGNKRAGAALLGASLRMSGHAFAPDHDGFQRAVLAVASGEWGYSELLAWVEANAG